MKNNDLYRNHKGNEYMFICIALPLLDELYTSQRYNLKYIGKARYHENDRDVQLYADPKTMVIFVNLDVPAVLYKSAEKESTGNTWVREVDNFFGYCKNQITGQLVKRFSRIGTGKLNATKKETL